MQKNRSNIDLNNSRVNVAVGKSIKIRIHKEKGKVHKDEKKTKEKLYQEAT